jgi:hypothetical protein
MSSEPEQVDHPSHYQMPGGLEVIDLVEHMPFNLGNAVKYICRAGKKPGMMFDKDIEKAIWYLRRELERCGPSGEPWRST